MSTTSLAVSTWQELAGFSLAVTANALREAGERDDIDSLRNAVYANVPRALPLGFVFVIEGLAQNPPAKPWELNAVATAWRDTCNANADTKADCRWSSDHWQRALDAMGGTVRAAAKSAKRDWLDHLQWMIPVLRGLAPGQEERAWRVPKDLIPVLLRAAERSDPAPFLDAIIGMPPAWFPLVEGETTLLDYVGRQKSMAALTLAELLLRDAGPDAIQSARQSLHEAVNYSSTSEDAKLLLLDPGQLRLAVNLLSLGLQPDQETLATLREPSANGYSYSLPLWAASHPEVFGEETGGSGLATTFYQALTRLAVSIDHPEKVSWPKAGWRTPLGTAIDRGRYLAAEGLLFAGADPTLRPEPGAPSPIEQLTATLYPELDSKPSLPTVSVAQTGAQEGMRLLAMMRAKLARDAAETALSGVASTKVLP